MLQGLAAIVIGYLLGSFPTAYIVAKLRKGIDIRDVDVRNMGAGAVIRQVGRRAGAAVAITDIAKGSASVLVARALGVSEPWVLGAAFAAVVGHNLPVYVGFRGGQGAATIIGIFLVISPLATAVCFAIMAIALYITRQIFSILVIASPFLPLFIWLFDGSLMTIIFSLAIVAALYYRNRNSLKQVWVRITRAGKIERDIRNR
jgi:glycerol-3-phosphate acyltransferase PlsY